MATGPLDTIGTEPRWAPIARRPRIEPLIGDYEARYASFTWESARDGLDGLPGGGLNIAHEAVDRHADGPSADVVALRCVARDDRVTDLTYAQLRERTDRFGAMLHALGVGPGDGVCSLLTRGPELYVTALGTMKAAAVFCPLFPAFGPEPVRERLELGRIRVLVTTAEAYRRKVAAYRAELPDLRHVLIVGDGPAPQGTTSLDAALAAAAGRPFRIAATRPEDPALLHFTSGTTGKPKGAVHVHEAVVAHHATAAFALDLRPGDVYWCTADPGWVTGTSYGIIGPLTRGVTIVTDAGDFDSRRWYQLLADQHVTVWYTAPTALRMLMASGGELPRRYDLRKLRHVVSVGEPLNPEAVMWGDENLGLPIHDTWWQTETGAIMISNYPGLPVRPGSMGRPMPGIRATILERGEDAAVRRVDGHVREVEPESVGELALRPGWPSMFRDYLNAHERYEQCFADGWYLTGDLARRDRDGYFWFVGRGDDVIKSAGHLIGPFEVESALMEHAAVVEAGVIGKPDPVAGEIVKAFVTLRPGIEPDEDLRRELIAFGRRRLGTLAPREIAFDQHLPHTRSGKVMRRLLKARELGLEEGDLSTLENRTSAKESR
ncbi:MAG TPA: acetate--CoA ligase [Jatrophihabitans sp.]|uniref:acetate--CoA ligase n=1 Tax=Jatrophihabitans sp. TaxID=1932789 RepID=UPI002E0BEB50|nr:acetate--CoA ligase [Jatrophihabitans sp.]